MSGLGRFATSTWVLVAATVLACSPQSAAASNAAAESNDPEVLVPNVVFYYQTHNLSCEEAAVSMALTHEGIVLDQEAVARKHGATILRAGPMDANTVYG